MLHRRSHGDRRAIAISWQLGADLMFHKKGKPTNYTRLWLCRDCHLNSRQKGSLLEASGFKAIWGHLLKHHRIERDGIKISIKPGTLKQHFRIGLKPSSTQDFDPEQQRLVVSAFPD